MASLLYEVQILGYAECWIYITRDTYNVSRPNYVIMSMQITALQWRHNERDCVSNDRRLDCLFNRLFRPKKTSKLRVTGLCLWRETTGDRWISLTKGRVNNADMFHLLTSSWDNRMLLIAFRCWFNWDRSVTWIIVYTLSWAVSRHICYITSNKRCDRARLTTRCFFVIDRVCLLTAILLHVEDWWCFFSSAAGFARASVLYWPVSRLSSIWLLQWYHF